jgi:phosphatidate cytidylyltransferase
MRSVITRGASGASERVLAEARSSADTPQSASGSTSGGASGTAPGESSWRDLRLRLISAGVLAPLGLACLLNGGWVFVALVLLAMTGIGVEWAGLTRARTRSLPFLFLLAWPGLSLLVTVGIGWLTGLRVLLVGLLLGPLRGSGIVLIGAGGLSLVWIRGMTGAAGPASLLFVVLTVWSSDSMAYLVGRALGGPKLAPRISPGKTWSGALGGLAGAMIAGAIVAAFGTPGPVQGPPPDLFERILRGLLFGGLLGTAAQAGDLAESAFKRRCGVKDSGRLIPGHGGLLDRLDGLMAAAPVAALLSLGSGPAQAFWQLDPLNLQPIAIKARHMAPGWIEERIASAREKQE